MRQIGTIDTESHARIFRAYLLTRGIHSDVDQRQNRSWAVWVHEETRLDEARNELERFISDPKNPVYVAARDAGLQIEKEQERENQKYKKLQTDLRLKWHVAQMTGGRLTLALILISVAVFVLQNVPSWSDVTTSLLSIQGYRVAGNMLMMNPEPLSDVLHGQVWRLVTPIFLHFGILHILFNMMWLKMLGGAVEEVQGPWKLALHVLVYAVAGNVVQYFWSGPMFGGMSGVVYGLFAYVWLVGREERDPRYYIDRFNVGLMLFWFFACLFGIIPHVANGAHAAGLVLGAAAALVKLKGRVTLGRR